MVVTKQVNSQLEWLSTLSTSFNAMGEDEKFLRKVSVASLSLGSCSVPRVLGCVEGTREIAVGEARRCICVGLILVLLLQLQNLARPICITLVWRGSFTNAGCNVGRTG